MYTNLLDLPFQISDHFCHGRQWPHPQGASRVPLTSLRRVHSGDFWVQPWRGDPPELASETLGPCLAAVDSGLLSYAVLSHAEVIRKGCRV